MVGTFVEIGDRTGSFVDLDARSGSIVEIGALTGTFARSDMSFVIYREVDWNRRLVIVDEDTDLPADLTGLTIEVTLKRRSTEAALITLTVGDGITLCDQTGDTLGMADLLIAGADSVDLEAANHVIAVLIDDQVVIPPTKLPVRIV